MKLNLRATVLVAAMACLSACGGGGGGGGGGFPFIAPTPSQPEQPNQPSQPNQPNQPNEPSQPNEPAKKFMIRGSVSGLATGARLILQNNGSDDVTIAANGAFSFTIPVSAYSVTIGVNPLWQFCKVGDGSGTASADVVDVKIDCSNALAQVSTIAGKPGVLGYADGAGSSARFNAMDGLDVDANGDLYVGDLSFLLRKVTAAGVVTTVAGTYYSSSSVDGVGSGASFGRLTGVAVGPDGNIYVAESYSNVIRKVTPAGVVTTLAGTPFAPGSADGTGPTASFNGLNSLAVGIDGALYVTDGNNTIRKVTLTGVVTTIAGAVGVADSVDGAGLAARFASPYAIAADGKGNIYIGEYMSNLIRRMSPSGEVTTFAGTAWVRGSKDGVGTAASFNGVTDLATDADGNIFVADSGNSLIRRITPDGVVSTVAGTQGLFDWKDGIGRDTSFKNPAALAVDTRGNVYVSDGLNGVVRKMTPVPAP